MEFSAFANINDRIKEAIDIIIRKEVSQLMGEFEGSLLLCLRI